jgi:hypothetical protein
MSAVCLSPRAICRIRCKDQPVAPREHRRSRCSLCDAELVYLAGDPTVPFEDIDPIDGGPRTLVEHSDQRCKFHQFLTPTPGQHALPGNANWLDKSLIDSPRRPRWIRTDEQS